MEWTVPPRSMGGGPGVAGYNTTICFRWLIVSLFEKYESLIETILAYGFPR